MEKKYKYKRDRRSKRITTAIILLIVGGFLAVHFMRGGAYLPAWIIVVILGIVVFGLLSIPRFILLNDDVLEIHCVVELTRIHVEDIETIRRYASEDFKKLYPLMASYGFWGYFGYYINFREWNLYKVYATKRKNMVLIEDIYEDTFVVNCEDADELIALAIEARNRKREEIFIHTRQTTDEQ